VFQGRYPAALRDVYGDAWPDWPADDMALLREPTDFVGVNYYTRSVTRHDPQNWPLRAATVPQPGATYTETGWEVCPQAFTDTLAWLGKRCGGVPLYVTENGAALYDPPTLADGTCDDPLRVQYLRSHLQAVAAAIQMGVDIRGYFAWSLLDNLEWAHGFSKRFGLVHVDFQTQRRTPKASARAYSQAIASRGKSLQSRP
jgi:beta-glucosidase